jgi:molybdopterin-guanine dinucleotide biosynthesis protein A
MAASDIAGVVLAGGRATRMGGADNPLLPLAGRPLLSHVVERLRPQVGKMALNANGDPARFEAFGLKVVADEDQTFSGPLAGILAGFGWARALPLSPEAIVTVAADTPFFPVDLVARLEQASGHGGKRIAVAASGGRRHPTFGLWPLALADELAEFIAGGGTLKVTAFIDMFENAVVEFAASGDIDPFFNVNTPQDLAKAEAIAAKIA